MRTRDPLANPAPLIRRVYSYVAYRIGEGAEAEDVVSDVFERALRYRESYDPARGEPLAWLLGIARRSIEDARLRGGEPTVAEAVEQASRDDVEGTAVQRLSLAASINELDERDRDLLALRYGADLSARQIGSIVGLKTNAVEVALHRALARLRALLLDDEQARPAPQRAGLEPRR
jgi:RNA polymerase sigma-70 factor, ECF subfamily